MTVLIDVATCDAMLIGVDNVDMVSRNGTVFLRALLMHVACVALC